MTACKGECKCRCIELKSIESAFVVLVVRHRRKDDDDDEDESR